MAGDRRPLWRGLHRCVSNLIVNKKGSQNFWFLLPRPAGASCVVRVVPRASCLVAPRSRNSRAREASRVSGLIHVYTTVFVSRPFRTRSIAHAIRNQASSLVYESNINYLAALQRSARPGWVPRAQPRTRERLGQPFLTQTCHIRALPTGDAHFGHRQKRVPSNFRTPSRRAEAAARGRHSALRVGEGSQASGHRGCVVSEGEVRIRVGARWGHGGGPTRCAVRQSSGGLPVVLRRPNVPGPRPCVWGRGVKRQIIECVWLVTVR